MAEKPNRDVTVSFEATEGGVIGRRAEDSGNLYVEPVAEEGYVFDGYYVNGEKIEPGRFEFSDDTTVEVRFVSSEQ